jgi:hypothetical protein
VDAMWTAAICVASIASISFLGSIPFTTDSMRLISLSCRFSSLPVAYGDLPQ